MSKKFGVRVIYRKIRHAHYLYIKRNVEKVWGERYTLGARYLSKNTVSVLEVHLPQGRTGGTIIEYLGHKSDLNGDVLIHYMVMLGEVFSRG